MPARWPDLPPYESWRATCDTLHALSQVLGKLAATLAPPEPQLQHAALRLTARGIETQPLPAPDGSGTLVVALDLGCHEAVLEHSGGGARRVPLVPQRAVAAVTRDVLAGVTELAGAVELNLRPQETPWSTPLDEDEEHRSYDPSEVSRYFAAATRAGLVLAALRAPYRGRSTPVNAWWGTFDLAVSLYSGRSVEQPSGGFIRRNAGDAEQVEVGWWPGDARHATAAFFAFAAPAGESFAGADLAPAKGGWDPELGEYLLEWHDVVVSEDPGAAAVEFARAVVGHACSAGGWDRALAESALGTVPPLR